MKGSLASHGAEVNRRLPRGAENVYPQIGLGNVDQSAGTQLILLEGFAIHAHRQVVIDPSSQVPPVRRRQTFLSQSFKIGHAEDIRRLGNRQVLRPGFFNQEVGGKEAEKLASLRRVAAHY